MNVCRLQTWQVHIVATKITIECITGIGEKLAVFLSDRSARDHNMNFPNSLLHNLISYVLCLRVDIAFWGGIVNLT